MILKLIIIYFTLVFSLFSEPHIFVEKYYDAGFKIYYVVFYFSEDGSLEVLKVFLQDEVDDLANDAIDKAIEEDQLNQREMGQG